MCVKESKKTLDLLEFFEGRRNQAYQDSIGLWTVGVGHLLTQSELHSGKITIKSVVVHWREGLTDEQINALFFQDMQPVVDALNDALPSVKEDIFVVCCSLAFNVGLTAVLNSTLVRNLKQGDEMEAAVQLMKWVYAGGSIVKGLHNRRVHEQRIWLTGVYPS